MPRITWWALLARARTILGRRPWLFWAVVLVIGSVVALRVHGAERAAAAAQHGWGRSRTVWVATRDVAAGGALPAAARSYPAAMVPRTAITHAPDGPAARSVSAGEVLTEPDVASGVTPPAGWVVLALPGDHAPVLSAGDAVALFGGGTRRCDGVATGGGSEVVEVALPPECAAVLTTDLVAGDVVVGRAIAG